MARGRLGTVFSLLEEFHVPFIAQCVAFTLVAQAACTLPAAYLVGWAALFTRTTILVAADFWFADAAATAPFAIFFLILALWWQTQKEQISG